MNEHLLEHILAPDNLHTAWKRVKQNKGAAGVNGLGIADYTWRRLFAHIADSWHQIGVKRCHPKKDPRNH